MANKFKIGDLVSPNFADYLKMTIMKVHDQGEIYSCAWLENNVMKDKDFPEATLIPFKEPPGFNYSVKKGPKSPFRNLR